MLKLNLQMFAEDDDMILPDDYSDTPTETPQESEDTIELDEQAAEDTKPAEDQPAPEKQEPPTEPLKIPIKYNKEERLLTVEEAAELAQKGMNYDKAVERAKQEARDAYIAEQGHEWNGKKITTEAEYKQAIMERDLMQKYQDQGLPDEVVQELVENRKFREQYQSSQQEAETKQKQKADFDAFLEAFPGVDPTSIKPETWEKVNSGVPLKYAYMEQERAELLTKAKVQEQNQANQQKAIVRGVSDHGAGDTAIDPFIEGFDSIN